MKKEQLNLELLNIKLNDLLSKLPKDKEEYYRLLFEFNDYENNDYIKQYNKTERRIKIVKENKDINIDKKEMNKLRNLVNKYRKILKELSISNHYEFKKSTSPNK